MKTIVITGATDGIGRQTALTIAAAAAAVPTPLTLVLHGRNAERLAAAVAAVRQRAPTVIVEHAQADLASPAEVRQLARERMVPTAWTRAPRRRSTSLRPQRRPGSAGATSCVAARLRCRRWPATPPSARVSTS